MQERDGPSPRVPMPSCETFRDPDAFARAANDQATAPPTPFVSPAWLSDWWSTIGAARDVRGVVIREAGEVRLATVFVFEAEKQAGIPLRFAKMPGSEWGSTSFEGVDPEGGAALVRWLRSGECPPWSFVKFGPLSGPASAALQSSLGSNGTSAEKIAGRVPVIDVSVSWDEFLARRSSNFRRTVKRKKRNLQADHELLHVRSPDPSRVVDTLREISARSWQGTRGIAAVSAAGGGALYERMAAGGDGRGELVLSTYRVGSSIASYLVGVVWGETYHAIDTGFDPAYANLSPGFLIHVTLFEELCGGPVTSAELGFDAPYKQRFDPEYRENNEVWLFRRRWMGTLDSLRRKLGERRKANQPTM